MTPSACDDATKAAQEPWRNLIAVTTTAARSDVIARHPELLSRETVLLLADLVPKLLRSDQAQAFSAADCALMLAGKLRDPESMAVSLRSKANALYARGENRPAVEHHERALKLFREIGNLSQAARTLSSSIQPLILLGRYERAMAAADEARDIFTTQGNEWRLARVELNRGNILDRQDRFHEALECYERAYRYLLPHQEVDADGVAVALHNMAGCLVYLNDFRRAASVYEEARDFAARHDMPVLVAQADYNIAWLHYLRGEYSRAIALLRNTREACRRTEDRYHYALCHLDLSEIYLELKLSGEAAETADTAYAEFTDLDMAYEQARAMANLAIAKSQEGVTTKALELFAQARRAFVKEKNKAWPSLIDLYCASLLYDQERDHEARELCLSALVAFKTSNLPGKAALCHLLLARLHLRSRHLYQATRECARALKNLRRIESPSLSVQAYALMAQVQLESRRGDRAYASFQKARAFLEQLRNAIHGEELKISFMKDRTEIYEGLVHLCLQREPAGSGVREATEYIEQAKSRNLAEVLATPQYTSWTAAQRETDAARRLRELRQELNFYTHRIEIEQLQDSKHSREHVERLQTECREKERELLRLLRENAPDEANPGATRGILALEQIQESLSSDVTVLEYFEVRSQIVVALISRNKLQMIPLVATARLGELLRLFHFQMSKLRLGHQYVSAMSTALLLAVRKHLAELDSVLVDPVRPHLDAAHLIIAPHGPLHGLPFHALLHGNRYLIDEVTVSYAPSASVYCLCGKRNSTPVSGSLVMGIPDPTVPFVRQEVEIVAKQLPEAELFVGEKATAEILQQKASHSRFIHIATHGYFRQDNPMFSSIRLGDSHLSLYDLYQLKFNAELVTLSGCSTGLNVVSAGDELLGLPRGLTYAGARASLLTLWDVQDQSSAEFMQNFYRRLAHGERKAQALQQAMRNIREAYPHPYYWAPFVLIGRALDN